MFLEFFHKKCSSKFQNYSETTYEQTLLEINISLSQSGIYDPLACSILGGGVSFPEQRLNEH